MNRSFQATQMPDRDWWSALWPDPKGVLKKLGVPKGETAVDLCCGDGYFTAPLSRLAVSGKVYAVELDPEILQQATEYLARWGGGNCIVIGDDARNLALHVHESVAFALIANTLHGILEPDRTDLLQRVYDTLKPAGRLAIINWHPLPREETQVLGQPRGPATEMRMFPKQTRVTVEPVGFYLERIVDLSLYHYGMVFTRGDGTPWVSRNS